MTDKYKQPLQNKRRRKATKVTPDLVQLAMHQFKLDRYHARIFVHGTTISPAGYVRGFQATGER